MHLPGSERKYFRFIVGFLGLFLVTFLIFAENLVAHRLLGFDMTVIDWAQSRIDPVNTNIMKLFTFIGSPLVVIFLVILCAIVMYRSGKRWESIGFLAVNAGGAVFDQILKAIFHRQRPDIHRMVVAHGYSFPSGHSMASVVFYGTVTYFVCLFAKKTISKIVMVIGGIVLITLIGLSRIYLGVHYPSDVFAGFAAGGAWLIASMTYVHFLVKKRNQRSKRKRQ